MDECKTPTLESGVQALGRKLPHTTGCNRKKTPTKIKDYVHGYNFHSFYGPFIHKKWGKIDVLYDRRQVTYFTMQKKMHFLGLVQKYYFFVQKYYHVARLYSHILVQSHF